MKKIIFPIIAVLVVAGIARAVTVNGDATVVIYSVLSATQTQPLNFGIVGADTSAGTVVLSPAGAVTSGTLKTLGAANAGAFTISGQASTPLTITFGNGTVNNGGSSMAVDTFTSTTVPANSSTDTSGNLTLKVGATLHVGANQTPGTYNGTYTVTVSY